MTFSGLMGNAAAVAVALVLPLPGALIIVSVLWEYRAALSRWALVFVRSLHLMRPV